MGFQRSCRRLAFLALGLLAAVPASAQSATDFKLFFASQPGDYIGGGETQTYTQADGTVTVSSSATTVSVRIAGPSFSFWWDTTFSAPGGVLPGVYNTARRQPFTSFNGMSFSGSGRGCNTLTGRFVVLEAEYGPAGITKLAVDFEQHCEDAAPGLFGAIRYNSTINSVSPFGGLYPAYDLTIPTPSNGTVTSTGGLNCGSAGAACAATFGAATSVNLTATPDPGYIFAGWTEDCRGGAATSVHVNGPKQCGALFEAEAPAGPRTLFVFDSRPGDPIGGGKTQVYSPANSRLGVQLQSNPARLVFTAASVDAARETSWTIAMSAAAFGPLVPGTSYEGALFYAGQRPSLQVGSCSESFGRFVIHELVTAANGEVIRAAVDVEQQCGNDGGFFAALRFNSTVVDVVPFAGVYPVYRLSLTPPANGTIVGGAFSCGGAGATCEVTFSNPTSVALTATPDAGYVFAGWTGGACIGAATLTVRVNTMKSCAAIFEPLATTAARTRALFDYMPGARGTGSAAAREALSKANTEWTAVAWADGRTLEFTVHTLSSYGYYTSRRLVFSAPQGRTLTAGSAYAATRAPFASATPGMDATGSCSRLTGRFIVRELVLGTFNSVERAAIDFEEHCNDIDAAVFGSVRYNSTVGAAPFDGEYPRYALVVPAPAHGRVTGAGLDCAAGTGPCQADFAAPANVSVSAIPDTGYQFVGWTGACHGGESISFRVNTVRRCGAVFEAAAAAAPRALLRMAGQPGDAILRGRTEVYSLANSSWTISASNTLESLTVGVSGLVDGEEARWSLTFRAPSGEKLVAGTTYTNAASFGNQAVLQISGGGFCSVAGSSFTIRHLVIGAQNKVMRAAVDFEAHCDTISSPAVFGTIDYVETTDASRLTLDKGSLTFTSTSSGNDIGQTTAPQQVRLSQAAGANVAWTASSSVSWLRVTPASGSGPATLTVSIQPVGPVAVGTRTGTVTVAVGPESLPPVLVTWTLLPDGGSAPFGNFDTPIAMTYDLTGAVALTGWALDDVEVTGVQIWRQPHPADPPVVVFQGPGPRNGKVFVGDATMVDGARPDVEALYTVPNRSRAGWGYMLLTRGLVWDGGGLFTVHAIATDRDGHTTEIGSTAFSINNALATKPFGTIDTPGAGVTASGRYANTGWVLTPNAGASIAPENVRVVIDGAFVAGVPSVAARADITSFFPTFDTSEAGRGLFIDTTAFADGVHTIAWVATDSTGQVDGIGSRFFRVANGGAGALAAAARAAARSVPGASSAAVNEAAPAMSAIMVRRGFDPAAPFDVVYGSSAPYAVDFEELDRIEVRFPEAAGGRATAYLRALGELRPLPAGASFDRAGGVFTWQPGPGYIGRYDIVVVVTDRQGGQSRYEVQVTLQPKRK